MKPKNRPALTSKAHLDGLSYVLYALKSLLQVLSIVRAFFGFYQHVVNINLHGLSQQWSEHFGYQCNTLKIP